MLNFVQGDMFEAPVDVRVNTVNCVGVMGAGVALAFRERYPEMFREYKKACKNGRIQPGEIDVWRTGTEWVINFPTKRHWRNKSRYEDIEAGLKSLRTYLATHGPIRVALPALGCGHGGLDWTRVSRMIRDQLAELEAEVLVFEPSDSRALGEDVHERRRRSSANSSDESRRRTQTADEPHARVQDTESGRGLLLSAVEVRLSKEQFSGALIAYPGDSEYRTLVEAPLIFAHRLHAAAKDEEVLVVPLTREATMPGGAERATLPVARFRRVLGTMIERVLPELLPEALGLVRRRFALERLKRDEDLVALAFRAASIPRPPALAGVSKHVRTSFQFRTEYVRGRGSMLLMTIQFGVGSVINKPMAQFVSGGVAVEGLRASRNEQVGYVQSVSGDDVRVETEMGEAMWPLSETSLTPSSDAMRRVFAQVLNDVQLSQYYLAEAGIVAKRLSGDAYANRLRGTARWFSQRGSIQLADAISFGFGDLVTLSASQQAGPVSELPPIEYCFSRDRTALSTIPARGLAEHGPADADTFDRKEPALLVLYPSGQRGAAEQLVRTLREGLPSSGAFAKGFAATFRLSRFHVRFVGADIDESSDDPGNAYLLALLEGLDPSDRTDAAIVILRDEDADLPDETSPYVATKAWLLGQGIPSQEIRLSKATESSKNLQYILQDFCVALYAKLGGSPWTVLPATPLVREVVLGLAYSETSERFRQSRRYMGITTVFSSDGTYILGASSPLCSYDEYPTVLAESVRSTMRRLAADQHWSPGDDARLVFHMGKTLTRDDIGTLNRVARAELVDGVRFETAFLTVRKDHPFVLVDPRQRGRSQWVDGLDGKFGKVTVGQSVPRRGTMVDLGRSRRLLCVTGPQQLKFEGGAHPTPLLVELHRDSTYTDVSALARQVFQFTGLSWKSVRPLSEPVTLAYPRLIARLVSRLSTHPAWSADLMNTRLLRSRWFL